MASKCRGHAGAIRRGREHHVVTLIPVGHYSLSATTGQTVVTGEGAGVVVLQMTENCTLDVRLRLAQSTGGTWG